MSREEHIAYNESWSRQLNERKGRWMEAGDPVTGFRCECWQANCIDRIPLSGREWKEVRSQGNRFAVAAWHIASDMEAVVEEYPHFWIIESTARREGWPRSWSDASKPPGCGSRPPKRRGRAFRHLTFPCERLFGRRQSRVVVRSEASMLRQRDST